MTAIQDAHATALIGKGFSGSLNDMTSAWLKSLPSFTDEVHHIDDLWREFFLANVTIPASNQDMANEYLSGLGFLGSLDDMWLDFWQSGQVP